MRATLQFNLDDIDDRVAHLRCTRSLDLALALSEMGEEIRKWVKYSESDTILIADVQTTFYRVLDDYGIDISQMLR